MRKLFDGDNPVESSFMVLQMGKKTLMVTIAYFSQILPLNLNTSFLTSKTHGWQVTGRKHHGFVSHVVATHLLFMISRGDPAKLVLCTFPKKTPLIIL